MYIYISTSVSGFEKRGDLEQKDIFTYVDHEICLNKGFLTNFKVVKMDIQGPSYGRLNFTKCIDTHRKHKH